MPGKRHGKEIGAGNGNRTRIVGLGSRCLTIRRYPQNRSARSIEDFPANRQPAPGHGCPTSGRHNRLRQFDWMHHLPQQAAHGKGYLKYFRLRRNPQTRFQVAFALQPQATNSRIVTSTGHKPSRLKRARPPVIYRKFQPPFPHNSSRTAISENPNRFSPCHCNGLAARGSSAVRPMPQILSTGLASAKTRLPLCSRKARKAGCWLNFAKLPRRTISHRCAFHTSSRKPSTRLPSALA